MKKTPSPGKKLRALIKKQTQLIPGVYDCLSAHLAQNAGFAALYLSGAGVSVSLLGKPDIGLLTMDEMADTAKRIVDVIKIPLLVDVDTGYGGDRNVARCIQTFESIGCAGVQIEDQVFPKRCGHLSGKSVIPVKEMVQKIKSAIKARKNKDFMIVARTDARAVEGLKKALSRAQAYRKAGADMIFPEALQSSQEFQQFSRRKGVGPLVANMTEFGISPPMRVEELARLGYRAVLFPMTAFRSAAFSMERNLAILKAEGQSRSFLGRLQRRTDLYKLIDYQRFNDREHIWKKKV